MNSTKTNMHNMLQQVQPSNESNGSSLDEFDSSLFDVAPPPAPILTDSQQSSMAELHDDVPHYSASSTSTTQRSGFALRGRTMSAAAGQDPASNISELALARKSESSQGLTLEPLKSATSSKRITPDGTVMDRSSSISLLSSQRPVTNLTKTWEQKITAHANTNGPPISTSRGSSPSMQRKVALTAAVNAANDPTVSTSQALLAAAAGLAAKTAAARAKKMESQNSSQNLVHSSGGNTSATPSSTSSSNAAAQAHLMTQRGRLGSRASANNDSFSSVDSKQKIAFERGSVDTVESLGKSTTTDTYSDAGTDNSDSDMVLSKKVKSKTSIESEAKDKITALPPLLSRSSGADLFAQMPPNPLSNEENPYSLRPQLSTMNAEQERVAANELLALVRTNSIMPVPTHASVHVSPTSNNVYKIVLYLDGVGFQTLLVNGKKTLNQIVHSVFKSNSDSYYVVAIHASGQEEPLHGQFTVESVVADALQPPKFLLKNKNSEVKHTPVRVHQLPDGKIHVLQTEPNMTVKRALDLLTASLPHLKFGLYRVDDHMEIPLMLNEMPFAQVTESMQFILRAADLDESEAQNVLESAVPPPPERRYVRIYFNQSYRSVEIDNETTCLDVLQSILLECYLTEADAKNYRLCLVMESGGKTNEDEISQYLELLSLKSNDRPMEVYSEECDEFVMQRLSPDNTVADRNSDSTNTRAREMKRTAKLAGFFGVKKNESEIRMIRSALSTGSSIASVGRRNISRSANELSQLERVSELETATPTTAMNNTQPEMAHLSSKPLGSAIKLSEEEERAQMSLSSLDLEKESSKRAGKLANFFGVKSSEKEVDQLRNMIGDNAEETVRKRRNKDTRVFVRIHMVDLSYKHLSITTNTTADQVVRMFWEKLNTNDSHEKYAIYECTQSGAEREVAGNECIYDVMTNWRDKQIFKFKLKSNAQKTATVNPKKRAAKLAGFFGVSEVDMMLKALNSLQQGETMPDLKEQPVQIDKIQKEGWLSKQDPHNSDQWQNCWCYIENGYLNIRPNHHDSADRFSAEESDSMNQLCLPLQKCIIVNQSKLRKSTFQIIYNDFVTITLAAQSLTDCDDWIACLKLMSDQETPTVPDVTEQSMTSSIVHSSQTSIFTQRKPSIAGTASTLQSRAVSRLASAFNVNQPATTGAAPVSPAKQRVNISDFEVHKVLGQGQYGKVFLCSQKSTGLLYAIKVIKKSNSPDTSKTENRILRGIRHPFIVGLHYAFQTSDKLHLVMEYVNGGELFFHLSHNGRFSEDRARFYAAEILLALQCLHGKGIVYRDLKLENILLDKEGHIKITDFGLSKQESEDGKTVTEPTSSNASSQQWDYCGTLEYFAPEILIEKRQSYPADWWAFGVVLFEMLCGFHPFYSSNRSVLYARILQGPIPFPETLSPLAIDLISKLLIRDPRQRLGASREGGRAIQNHPFFESIDFTLLFKKQLTPPYRPEITNEFDVSFFDMEFTQQAPVITPPSQSQENLDNDDEDFDDGFDGFSYRRASSMVGSSQMLNKSKSTLATSRENL